MFRGTQNGQFWLLDQPEHVENGTLTVDDKGRLELVTQGLMHPTDESVTPRTIRGATRDGYVTLVEAQSFSRSHSFNRYLPAQYHETWFCGYAFRSGTFEGDHLGEDVVSIEVEIESLPRWARAREGPDFQLDWDRGMLSWPVGQPTPAGGWSLGEIGIRREFYPSLFSEFKHSPSASVEIRTSFVVNFDRPQPLETICDVVSSLQALVSIGMGYAAKIERVALTVNTGTVEHHLLLHYEPVSYPVDPAPKGSELFSVKELGGLEGVGQWLDVLRDQAHTKNGLLADTYRRPVFITDVTSHLLIALEAYERHTAPHTRHHSLSRKDGYVQTRELLKSALGSVGQMFLDWIGDCEGWKRKVSNVRREQVAHLENYGNASVGGKDVYLLNRQLYTLLVVCILSQCGLSEDLLEKVVTRSRSDWRTLV